MMRAVQVRQHQRLRALTSGWRAWLGMLALPLIVNGLLWRTVTLPQERALLAVRHTRSLTQLKPTLETLVGDSQRLITAWSGSLFSTDNPSAVMRTVQQLADAQRLQITELIAADAAADQPGQAASGGSAMSVRVEATGRFHQLARWISDLEAHPGLQIETWTFDPDAEAHLIHVAATVAARLNAAPAENPAQAGKRQGHVRLDAEETVRQLSQAVESERQRANEAGGYDVVLRRDPMRALVNAQGQMITAAGLSGGFAIQGIVWSDTRPLAIIDDALVAQGDRIGPYTIVRIQRDGVVVQREGVTQTIPLDHHAETP